MSADIWMTYHSYYKAPDLLGLVCRRGFGLPYVIFQGIYSTKRRKQWRTLIGFVLNRRALVAADHVFTNRKEDLTNVARIVPEHKLTYVVPGILPEHFAFDLRVRQQMQQKLDTTDGVVVLSAAMFRPGVKSEGVSKVIRACGEIFRRNLPLYLVIAGDGKERNRLRRLADHCLPGRVRFLGRLGREEMCRFYSAGDVFAFPGIRESLGMVYLEAQSCGLPVVAFADGGVPEVVSDGVSGYLVRRYDSQEFNRTLARLVADSVLRRKMGEAARGYVRKHHDLHRNYQIVEDVLFSLVEERRSKGRREQGVYRS
jgi:glycosyltransferase involved in cell wall biosynthesis